MINLPTKFLLKLLGTTIAFIGLFFFSCLQAAAETEASGKFSLAECISLAFSNNPSYISSLCSVEESQMKITEARSSYYPSINLSASADRFSTAKDGSGGGNGAYSSYSAGVTARYYLYQGGKKSGVFNSAESMFQAASHQHENYLQELVLTVSQAYYRFLQAQHLEKASRQALERAEYYLEFAWARFEAGVVSRSDILKAEVEKSNADLSLIRARNARLFVLGSLNVLLGREAHLPLDVMDDLENIELKGILDFDALFSQALRLRPEIRKMEAQLAAQKSDIRIARSSFYPWVSADAGFNFSGLSLSGMKSGWFAGLTLDLPLFTGLATKARVAQERIALSALERQLQSLRLEIGLEVWNAYLDLKEAEERIDNTRVYMKSARENLAIAEEEYRDGVGSMIEVIDAETALVAAEESQIETLADFKIALAVLNRVTAASWYEGTQGDM
jgi:outer membrane protein TolC